VEVSMKKEKIALILVDQIIRRKMADGGKVGPRLRKETSKLAKKTGIPKRELVSFLKGQMKGVIKDAFKK